MPEFSFSELCSSAALILFQCIHSLVYFQKEEEHPTASWRLFDWCYTCAPQHSFMVGWSILLSAKQLIAIYMTLSHIAWQGTSADSSAMVLIENVIGKMF
jgi:hypothetical protein